MKNNDLILIFLAIVFVVPIIIRVYSPPVQSSGNKVSKRSRNKKKSISYQVGKGYW